MDRPFCSMWRTVGFMMSFAVVMEFVTIVAYVVMLAGGRQKRAQGWKVLVAFAAIAAATQCASMALIVRGVSLLPFVTLTSYAMSYFTFTVFLMALDENVHI